MIKWFAYIVLLLIMTPALLSAKNNGNQYAFNSSSINKLVYTVATDTTSTTNKNTKKQSDQDNKKIKEIGKAKRQPKPEKIEPADASGNAKPKPKRQRRPEGLERPPEIPRRNGGG